MYSFCKRLRFAFLAILTTAAPLAAQQNDSVLLETLAGHNFAALNRSFDATNINKPFGHDSLTPIMYAIRFGNNATANILLYKGANVNLLVSDRTALMLAAEKGNFRMVKKLIENGANINQLNSQRSSSLIFAAINGNKRTIRYLLKNGAYLNHHNLKGLDAIDYATLNNQKPACEYMKSFFERHLPNYFDGPYLQWHTRRFARLVYLQNDSLKRRSHRISKLLCFPDSVESFNGLSFDTNRYVLHRNYTPQEAIYSGIDSIMVIGDVHGGYNGLCQFLINNHITDNNLNWQWGKRHLVFMGDIFDRGEQVTEALWLIYKLDKQALAAGGRMHLLLGNHEIMILTGDYSYLSDKYFYLCKAFRLEYTKLFSKNTELGKWLRSKNTVIKINQYLFVHGGLSPRILNYSTNLNTINSTVRNYLNGKSSKNNYELESFLISPVGPFWYRGYLASNHCYDKILPEQLNTILTAFNVTRIVVGHSNVPFIKTFDDQQVFATDVPYYLNHTLKCEGLLINGNNAFRVLSNGEQLAVE
jgi:hypothetical protein